LIVLNFWVQFVVLLFSLTKQHTKFDWKIAGAELNVSAEDIDYSNKAEERLTCDYQGMICKWDTTLVFNWNVGKLAIRYDYAGNVIA
jgi:hypothetical protein